MRCLLLAAIAWLAFAGSVFSQAPQSTGPALTYSPIAEQGTSIDELKELIGWCMYFDERLSSNGTISCATCHVPRLGNRDGLALNVGVNGTGTRRTPNNGESISSIHQFGDGRTFGLLTQATQPLQNIQEMGNNSENDVYARLYRIPGYRDMFSRAYGNQAFESVNVVVNSRFRRGTVQTINRIDRDAYANSMLAFQAMLAHRDAPIDKFLRKEAQLSEEEKIGFNLCRRASCFACHEYPRFTNHSFRNNGMAFATGVLTNDGQMRVNDTGREQFLRNNNARVNTEDVRAFKVPTIRDVGKAGPFAHNGRFINLKRVVQHYNSGGAVVNQFGKTIRDRYIDQIIQPQQWNEYQEHCVEVFLHDALTSPSRPPSKPKLPE